MNRSILVIVGGGIAAYRSLELVRLFVARGVSVRPVLTRGGREFVTPLSLAALSGSRVHEDLWSLTDEAEMGHIQLSRAADLIVVAPATADLMAKAANGLADDLASTLLLATDKRVMMAPAMNVRMWEHPATRRNLATLVDDGVRMVGPDEGAMACGEFGPGRMAQPQAIFDAALDMLTAAAAPGSLAGLRALVTAGPTQEPVDAVRYLSNRSSGRQGYAVAEALAAAGAQVTLVSGPVCLAPPPGVTLVRVETAAQMLAACDELDGLDVAVMVAAVADWRPEAADLRRKLKKAGRAPEPLHMVENPDILARLARPGPRRPRLVIGFAAETEAVEANARAKLARKGCDWIVANDVSDEVMGGAHNAVTLLDASGAEAWPRLDKAEVARRLVARIAATLNAAPAR